jgi:hypothetical protein
MGMQNWSRCGSSLDRRRRSGFLWDIHGFLERRVAACDERTQMCQVVKFPFLATRIGLAVFLERRRIMVRCGWWLGRWIESMRPREDELNGLGRWPRRDCQDHRHDEYVHGYTRMPFQFVITTF